MRSSPYNIHLTDFALISNFDILLSGWGFKGENYGRGGGPKRSYTGGVTKGELLFNKS